MQRGVTQAPAENCSHSQTWFSFRYPDTSDTAAAINQLGCKHVSTSVAQSHVDQKNKLVTTSAFMCDAPIHEIFDGIGSMVQSVLKLA